MEWLISINLGLLYQVAIQAVTFLVFFFLVKKLFFDKVSDMMEKRKALIEGDLQDAQTASENAKKLEETYNEKITNIESERYDIMKKAAKDGEVVKERIIADAHGEADQIIASAKREIEIQVLVR